MLPNFKKIKIHNAIPFATTLIINAMEFKLKPKEVLETEFYKPDVIYTKVFKIFKSRKVRIEESDEDFIEGKITIIPYKFRGVRDWLIHIVIIVLAMFSIYRGKELEGYILLIILFLTFPVLTITLDEKTE